MGVINLDMSVEEQYNHNNWIDLKKRILQRDKYTCTICKKKYIELHVHHMIYPKGKFIWEIDEKFLIIVCKECHEKIHDKKLNVSPLDSHIESREH
jgi:5-methylcytosine-specific restriction endonuclease McrA